METTTSSRAPEISPTGKNDRASANLLQVAGAAAIVAFHTGAPGSQAGWMATEVFFLTAGMNMASTFHRDPSALAYVGARAKRLMPEMTVIWLIVVAMILAGKGTPGMAWFAGSAPFFLQNLTPPFFDYTLPKDAVFGPLWFIGALIQLQMILFLTRKLWRQWSPLLVLGVAFGVGLVLRLGFAIITAHHLRHLPVGDAESLYCMPFCHIEAMTLGVLLGRNSFPRFGRLLPLFLALVAAAGIGNFWLSSGQMPFNTLGFEFPLRANGSYLWGYPILALLAGSLCANDGYLAKAIHCGFIPAPILSAFQKIAPLTFGIYIFHGLIIATGINGATALAKVLPGGLAASLAFLITFAEATFLSAIFIRVRQKLVRA